MGTATSDGAFAADRGLRFEQDGVEIGEDLQLQSRNFLADEVFDRLQCSDFFAVHQRKCVAHILRASGSADAMNVIFRMFRDIIIDDVTDAGNVESARRDISRHHHFVLAAFESFQRFNPFALGSIGMQDGDRMFRIF